jgi:Domain of unknown function (DUF2703)
MTTTAFYARISAVVLLIGIAAGSCSSEPRPTTPARVLVVEHRCESERSSRCRRCVDTKENIAAVVRALGALEPPVQSTVVHSYDGPAAELDVHRVYLNGKKLENLLPNVRQSFAYCFSCSEQSGHATSCPVLHVDSVIHEAIPKHVLWRAALQAMDLDAAGPPDFDP